jgi:hypothetical protein
MKNMGAVTRRIRQVLAMVLVGLLPGAIYFWEELCVSGYTRNSDGSRDIVRMEKLLTPGSITDIVLVLGVLTIGSALISLTFARATGRITAARLTVIATGLGVFIPLIFEVSYALAGQLPWQLLPGPSIGGAAAAFILSSVFSLVAGLPLPAYLQGRFPVSDPPRAAIIVLGVAAAVTILVLGWLAYLYAWALAHPCPGCFG